MKRRWILSLLPLLAIAAWLMFASLPGVQATDVTCENACITAFQAELANCVDRGSEDQAGCRLSAECTFRSCLAACRGEKAGCIIIGK